MLGLQPQQREFLDVERVNAAKRSWILLRRLDPQQSTYFLIS